MSTYTPSWIFSIPPESDKKQYLYSEKFYDLLEIVLNDEHTYNVRSYTFRGERHISALKSLCTKEKLLGLDFVNYQLAIIEYWELEEALKSLKKIRNIIELSIETSNINRLLPATHYFYSSCETGLIDDVIHAYSNTGDLTDVAPYHTGGDEGSNVLQSFFDYIKSLDEIIKYCIDKKHILVNFHCPA